MINPSYLIDNRELTFILSTTFVLLQRLKALDDGWVDLQKMVTNKEQVLSQSLNLQVRNEAMIEGLFIYAYSIGFRLNPILPR